MTASSVDIFPCRVQLIGLPQASNTSLAATNRFNRTPIAKIHRVSRNLFGSPDPTEMTALYEQEAERVRSYVMQRYNIDTKALKYTNERELERNQSTDKINTSLTLATSDIQPIQIPVLIDKELRQHKHRLGERYNPAKFSKWHTNCNIDFNSSISNSESPTVERQKLYRRQSLLKETFNIRKNRVCMEKGGQDYNLKENNLENSQNPNQNMETLQLSQHLIFQQTACDTPGKKEELPTFINSVNKQNDEIEENRCRTNNSSDNCTTMSLKLVGSTQNTS